MPLGQGPETTVAGRPHQAGESARAKRWRAATTDCFARVDGTDAPPDANVRLATGVLESSNVNVADAMVNMIELSRHFDLQVKAMRTAEENAAAAAQLLQQA